MIPQLVLPWGSYDLLVELPPTRNPRTGMFKFGVAAAYHSPSNHLSMRQSKDTDEDPLLDLPHFDLAPPRLTLESAALASDSIGSQHDHSIASRRSRINGSHRIAPDRAVSHWIGRSRAGSGGLAPLSNQPLLRRFQFAALVYARDFTGM